MRISWIPITASYTADSEGIQIQDVAQGEEEGIVGGAVRRFWSMFSSEDPSVQGLGVPGTVQYKGST